MIHKKLKRWSPRYDFVDKQYIKNWFKKRYPYLTNIKDIDFNRITFLEKIYKRYNITIIGTYNGNTYYFPGDNNTIPIVFVIIDSLFYPVNDAIISSETNTHILITINKIKHKYR